MGTAGRAVAAVAAAIALVGVAAGQASAGTYVVVSCQAPGADGRNNAWTQHIDAYPGVEPQPTAYAVTQECRPGGRGLYVESAGGADARFLTSAYFKFAAPAGTRIVQLKVTRSGDKQRLSNDAIGDGWTVSANGDGNVVVGGVFGETCSIPNGAPSCSLPGTTPAPYPLNTSQITYGIACTRADSVNPYNCPVAANGVPAARLGVRATEVTLSDDSNPTMSAAGPLLGDAWVPATATAAVTASDNTGIRAVRVLVDGAERTVASGTCDFTKPVPCADVSGAQVGLGSDDLADGVHTVSVIAEDAAANPARVDKQVRIDFHAPQVVVALPRGGRVRATATDGASGLAGLTMVARDDRGGAERALTLSRIRGGRTSARFGPIPARHLVLRVTAQDRAGNVRGDEGRPSAIALSRARVGTRSRRIAHERVRVPFGRSVTVGGRLVDAAHHGLGGRAMAVATTLRVAGARRATPAATTTDARGRFSVQVPAGPSRVLRLAFEGGAGALRTVRALSLRVPASTTIAPSRRTVVGTGRVRFRGTVARRGQPIPRGGLTILLQGRQRGGWRTFKAARTDRHGRWRATYRFTGRPGSYPIRAYVRRSPAFPFDAGTSHVVRVRVR